MTVIIIVVALLSVHDPAWAFSPDGHSALEPAQYLPYPPGVYGPMPVPAHPPGVRLPRQNYWYYEPRPFPQMGGRWWYRGTPDPGYYRQGPRDRMYEEFCAWGGRCR